MLQMKGKRIKGNVRAPLHPPFHFCPFEIILHLLLFATTRSRKSIFTSAWRRFDGEVVPFALISRSLLKSPSSRLSLSLYLHTDRNYAAISPA